MKRTKVAFDVDGTLITQDVTGTDSPRYHVIRLFQLFQLFNCEMHIWSGGGIDYATRWAEKLGLDAKIVEKFSFEPDIIVDDGYEVDAKTAKVIKV